MNSDEEVVQLFLEESRENLETIEDDLLAIEEAGANIDLDLVNKVFRAMHTIKGGAGFFQLTSVKELAHAMENCLDLIRQKELIPNPKLVTILLDSADMVRKLLADYQQSNAVDISGYVQKINENSKPESEAKGELIAPQQKVEIVHPASQKLLFSFTQAEFALNRKGERGGRYVYLIEYDLISDIQRKGKHPWIVISELHKTILFMDAMVDTDSVGDLDSYSAMRVPYYILCSTMLEPQLIIDFFDLKKEQIYLIFDNDSLMQVTRPLVENQAPKQDDQAPKIATAESPVIVPSNTQSAIENIRVNVKLLDKLMTLAGELVLTRNELLQTIEHTETKNLESVSQRVDAITSQLQEAIMGTRMQTVGIVFTKFKRIVRDLAKSVHKKVDLKITGDDVDLDKTIIEAIGDPLTHLVRNAIDHGIESPAQRAQKGKSETGTLWLRAFHQAGQVVIEIQDDGAGINPDIIKKKALSKGLISENQAGLMSDKEIIRLIFKPGFSTAETITDISGRGVGMDVVLTNLAKVGGVVDIDSKVGHGSVIRIKLPLTLAIIPSLLVQIQQERFALPQVNVLELVRIGAEDIKYKIEKIGDAPVMKLREKLLPLVYLRDVLSFENPVFIHPITGEKMPDKRKWGPDRRTIDSDAEKNNKFTQRQSNGRRYSYKSITNIAVVSSGDFEFGIIVDEFLDTAEIVVKPLGLHFSKNKEYAGATILGDGSVALILDVGGIRELAELLEVKDNRVKQGVDKKTSDDHVLLIVENAPKELFAVPLSMIARLEKIHYSKIQTVGARKAIHYRDGSLPLFEIEEVAQVSAKKEMEEFRVIVFSIENHEIGLLVSDIHDVVTVNSKIDEKSFVQKGIMGSIVLDETIIMMVDIYAIIREKSPHILERSVEVAHQEDQGAVLVVEDSSFFLNQMKMILQEQGYKFFTATDGEQGLKVFQENQNEIAMIFTDIEMPKMDGLELTKNIRKTNATIPIIAVTTLAGAAAEQAGFDAGVTEYQVKLDREKILHACERFVLKVGV
jgi:two-component system, chemotaxis family, sensor kinase CheA